MSSASPGILLRNSESTRSTTASTGVVFFSWICTDPIRLDASFGQNSGELYDTRPVTDDSCKSGGNDPNTRQ